MKYFLKKLGTLLLYSGMGAGLGYSALHILADFAREIEHIESEEQREKEQKK